MRQILSRYLRARGRDIRRFARAAQGATAIEFAIIAPAFIATLVAVFQVCIFVFAQMAIQNAAVQAGRYFMTGQAQTNGWSATTIIGMVCPSVLFTCTDMYIVVQDYSTFAAGSSFSDASTSAPAMYNGSTPLTQASYTFDTATHPGDIVVVQLVYAWPVVSAPFGFSLSNLPNNQAELMGVSAFRVEPY